MRWLRPDPDSEAATPSAVDTTPSIPFTPRFASTRGGTASAGANHSRSLMGMDADTTMVAPPLAAC